MHQLITTLVLIGGAIFAALLTSVSMAGAVHLTARKPHGYQHLMIYVMLLVLAVGSLLGGRDLTSNFLDAEELTEGVARHPLMSIIQPVASLIILAVSGERILTHWLLRERAPNHAQGLLIAFVFFWFFTVAVPAFFGANPSISHDYAYPLVIGIAACLATGLERDLAIKATRNALVLFMLGGFLVAPIMPQAVMDLAYNQGLIPGLPRMAGLASHAVSMGLLAQLGLLCLLARPYEKRWLNRTAWVIGLAMLFMAQSKTGWIAFFLCSACLVMVRSGPDLLRRAADPLRPELGIAFIVLFILGLLGFVGLVMFSDVGNDISNFLNSAEGAQLASMTGRDRIWAIAYDEWLRHPLFGYGPSIWDQDFRDAIGMPNATHAHNQFMDTLSRAGAVGASALVAYALMLLVLSLRFARATRGLTLALFVALLLRAISEVPLILMGYGPELIIHVLLLMVLAAALNDAHSTQRSASKAGSRGNRSFTRQTVAPARYSA
ncbi:MAG: O-antigen ligase family protein [Pseudomonadota bacterium]